MPGDRILIATACAAAGWFGAGTPAEGNDRVAVAVRDRVVTVPAGACRIGSAEVAHNPPVRIALPSFAMARYETTVEEYCRYLNQQEPAPSYSHPQIIGSSGAYRPRWSQSRKPVTHVSFDDAEGYCVWLSDRAGCVVRLPTAQEWEYAARSAISGIRYPWGWGQPRDRAGFDLQAPRRVGSYPPNPFGLFDMAGNVFEWCRSRDTTRDPSECMARGGSWSERDPDYLTVYRPVLYPCSYRDADVGFRVLVEIPSSPAASTHAPP